MELKTILRLLHEDGWEVKAQAGSHRQFVHATKKGKVTVPVSKKDIPIGTSKSILKQAGLE